MADSTDYDFSNILLAAEARNESGDWSWFGDVDEFRLTIGVGRYTGSYTPAIEPFPDAAVAPGPTIDTQPQAQSVTTGADATFTVAATTSGGTLTYQCYVATAGLLVGETTDTLVISTVIGDNGNGYYAEVTDDNGTTTSSTAALTVADAQAVSVGNIFDSMQVIKNPDRKEIYVSFTAYGDGVGGFKSAYACDAYSEGLINSGFGYVWLLNDKKSSYNGVMEEVGGSTILSAVGTAPHRGESTPILDSCEGVTAWRIRDGGYSANSASFAIYHPIAHELCNLGFGFACGISKPAGVIEFIQLLQVNYQYYTNTDHSVNVVVSITSATTINISVTSTGQAGADYNETYTLPTAIIDDESDLWYIEWNRGRVWVYLNDVRVMTHSYNHAITGEDFGLPEPGSQYTSAEVGMFNNSTWDHQALGLGGQLTAGQADALYASFQNNFTDTPNTIDTRTRTALVYNFEDDNYTWMDASEPTAEGLKPVVCMQYGFNPGWVTRWTDLIDTGETWADLLGEAPQREWIDFYSHGTEENMFWLTADRLLKSDQQIQLIDNPKEYFVERKHIDLDDLVQAWTTNKWKHLKQFYFHLQSPADIGDSANTFDIAVGWSKNLMDDPEWLAPSTINLQSTTNSGEYKYDFRTTGRYLAMKMDFSNTKEIKMTGGDLDASESHGR